MADERDEDDERDAPFAPPEVPVEVRCLHCHQTYMSDRIELRPDTILGGFAWCCPTPGCDAAGFGFDLLPTDPNYRDENGGWVESDDEDEFDDDEDMFEDDANEFEDPDDALPPADAPDEDLKRPDDAADRRRRLFGDDGPRHDDIPF